MMASFPASGVLPQLSMDATPSPSEFFHHLLGSSNNMSPFIPANDIGLNKT